MLNNYLQKDWLDILLHDIVSALKGGATSVYIIAYLTPCLIYIPHTILFDFITLGGKYKYHYLHCSNKKISSKCLFTQVIQLEVKGNKFF